MIRSDQLRKTKAAMLVSLMSTRVILYQTRSKARARDPSRHLVPNDSPALPAINPAFASRRTLALVWILENVSRSSTETSIGLETSIENVSSDVVEPFSSACNTTPAAIASEMTTAGKN
jgi:hypothetical protein